MTAIYVEITATRGSAPRDAGTAMKVTTEGIEGTIGGGALEHRAIQQARKMLVQDLDNQSETLPLGPNLGQCCGGTVSLTYTRAKRATDMGMFHVHQIRPRQPHPRHLWVWGAGHVGRAVVRACHPQTFKITWVDDAPGRFPQNTHKYLKKLPAADMPLLATRAERQADHLVFTYSHDIDLALCAALLKRDVRSIGLIGSATKRARFFKRLDAMGLDPSPIICPIGDKSRGKRPDQIASGVIDALLAAAPAKATA